MSGRPTTTMSRLGSLRSRLDAGLFPAPPERGSGFGRVEAGVLVAAVLILVTLLSLLRLGFSASLSTVWAEDGPIYLQAALTDGFWDAVSSPYAGYLVIVPRLIAEVGALVPLQYAAAAISIVSALIAALSGLAVWAASAGHVRDPYLRVGLGLATALAATAGQETLNSAAYAPWFMLVGAFWLLLWRPRTLGGAIAGGLFLLATGLSTPGVWFFIPVALLRAMTIRDSRDGVLLGSFALGAAVQVPVVLGQEQGEPLWSDNIWTAFLQRVVDGGVFGQRLGGNLWAELGWPFLIVLGLAILAGLALGLRRGRESARWFAAVAIVTSAVMFVVSAYQRTVGDNVFWSAGSSGGTASRYVMVPALLLLSALVVTVDANLGAALRRRASWAVAATLAVIALAIATSFEMSSSARGAPYWEDALRSAANKCLANGEEIAGIAASPPPFGVQIPCEDVASFAGERVRESAAPASGAP
jgi:hypothetical protein